MKEGIGMKKGLILTIEGSDGCGKKTQTELLLNYLLSLGYQTMLVDYPRYKEWHGIFCQKYLKEKVFGDSLENEEEIYAVCNFYAMDRFASYRLEWKEFYESGGIVILDRYATANMVHQAAKYDSIKKKKELISYLEDIEYGKTYRIPRPDLVMFLNLPWNIAEILKKERAAKENKPQDLYEDNPEFMKKSYYNGLWVAQTYGWQIIDCANEMEDYIRLPEEIAKMIQSAASHYLPATGK